VLFVDFVVPNFEIIGKPTAWGTRNKRENNLFLTESQRAQRRFFSTGFTGFLGFPTASLRRGEIIGFVFQDAGGAMP
jgi:hypothetical protein